MCKSRTVAVCCVLAIAVVLLSNDAQARWHQRHFGAHDAEIASINAQLRRWVHPTGRCGTARETLTTWYRDGVTTASGARFDAYGMTAAHRTLPFGTVLTVSYPATGRSVVVTVNDRGPFTDAELDLAFGAAQALGMRQSAYLCVSR